MHLIPTYLHSRYGYTRVLVLYVVCGIVVLKGSGWEGVEESVLYD